MAIYSCNISNVSRGKGSTSTATLAYITGKKIKDERLGLSFKFGNEDRVLYFATILPENAPEEYKNAEKLFNSIELYEKADNARTAKKIMVALPREFDDKLKQETVESFIKENLNSQGYAAVYAIHIDKANNNPHAHILVANRQMNNKGEWIVKSRKEYALDENGNKIPVIDPKTGLQKIGDRNRKVYKRISVQVNPLDQKKMLENLREQWAVCCNRHLEKNNQIDHRSYKAQGKDFLPTIHEGYAARQIEQQGIISERCDHNRSIKSYNELAEEEKAIMRDMKSLKMLSEQQTEHYEQSSDELYKAATIGCDKRNDYIYKRFIEISMQKEVQLEKEIRENLKQQDDLREEYYSWEKKQGFFSKILTDYTATKEKYKKQLQEKQAELEQLEKQTGKVNEAKRQEVRQKFIETKENECGVSYMAKLHRKEVFADRLLQEYPEIRNNDKFKEFDGFYQEAKQKMARKLDRDAVEKIKAVKKAKKLAEERKQDELQKKLEKLPADMRRIVERRLRRSRYADRER